MSKVGLEPTRPYERQPLKLVRLPISPLRLAFKIYLVCEQQPQRDDCNNPHKCQNSRYPVQITLSGRRTERRAAATTEHIRQTTTSTAVQKHTDDHCEHRNDIDHNCYVGDYISHAKILPLRLRKMARRHLTTRPNGEHRLFLRTNILRLPTTGSEATT